MPGTPPVSASNGGGEEIHQEIDVIEVQCRIKMVHNVVVHHLLLKKNEILHNQIKQ